MKKVKLNHVEIQNQDEISHLYETGEIFEIEIDANYDSVQITSIEIINSIIKNPIFIRNNSLITKQYPISNYFFEIIQYMEILFEYASQGKSFELSLESETINGIYVRANFTAKESKRMLYFRSEYDREDILRYSPDYNYDIRVIR